METLDTLFQNSIQKQLVVQDNQNNTYLIIAKLDNNWYRMLSLQSSENGFNCSVASIIMKGDQPIWLAL